MYSKPAVSLVLAWRMLRRSALAREGARVSLQWGLRCLLAMKAGWDVVEVARWPRAFQREATNVESAWPMPAVPRAPSI